MVIGLPYENIIYNVKKSYEMYDYYNIVTE